LRITITTGWSWRIRPIRAILAILFIVPFLSGCGLIAVNGPAPGWETANAEGSQAMALTQPCTTSKNLVLLDGLVAALSGAAAINALLAGDSPDAYGEPTANVMISLFTGAFGVITTLGAVKGNQKVNDCRAFNARIIQLRRK